MRRTRHVERGATGVEYALLISLIAAVVVVAVVTLGTSTAGLFNRHCQAWAAAGQPC